MSDHRYCHWDSASLQDQPRLREQGQKQAQLSLERYHYLCAAIQEKFELTTVPPDFSRAQLFPRAGLVFSSYESHPLDPILGIKLHPRGDGTIHPGDLKIYASTFRESWKCSEGGILYCIAEAREFWNMVLNFHSVAGTTGVKAWDKLFDDLRASHFNKGLIPCMFFAREIGCLDPHCPFLHDKESSIRARNRILAKRRIRLGKPTPRDIFARERAAMRAHQASQQAATIAINFDGEDDNEELDPELQQIFEESAKIRKICNNPACLKVSMRDDDSNEVVMKQCSRCTVATYCSKECQASDWKRHKKEPCLPFEELVLNDDLWNVWGTRKGTERFPITEVTV